MMPGIRFMMKSLIPTVGIQHKIRMFIICLLFGGIILPLLLGDILVKIYKNNGGNNENKN